ncbi:ABC transporter ATP-binding protein [Cohnella faecalis]|uniref:ABC transporter ATP-binding protein n=1 Tax=Cohnella faecalis TaxID=2315694 RepID=A0A398CSY7_9BACL|nr:ABC transporter ATP-binding protein [Cohnella faecalis]RIE04369.1 ABC transporter ATP-binding protein [Cohnella faecalis]
MSYVVEAKRLTKSFGKVKAVNEVSFALEEGKIYGLLGRNGAGKTTIMHMIAAQQFLTSGEISVFGERPYENDRVLERVCFIKESQKYPDHYRVDDVLKFAESRFKGWDREFASRLLDDFRLPLDRKMKKLSRGMLSSVGIIVGLASRAPLTIFDEPYIGLDAVARSLFYDRLLEDYAEFPRTIVLSTHLIDEVSRLLEHILLIDGGRLLLDEDAERLRGQAYKVVGPAAKVAEFSIGKEKIGSENMGGIASATFYSGLETKERRRAEALGLEITPVTLQQLIVHLTSGGSKTPMNEEAAL